MRYVVDFITCISKALVHCGPKSMEDLVVLLITQKGDTGRTTRILRILRNNEQWSPITWCLFGINYQIIKCQHTVLIHKKSTGANFYR